MRESRGVNLDRRASQTQVSPQSVSARDLDPETT